MGLVRDIIRDNQITIEDVPRIEDNLFYKGVKRRLDLESFIVLMFFATIIATYGVISDSTATVIGAMIVAPLMTPIMAVAAALVMGKMDQAGKELVVVVAGVIWAILISWFIGMTYSTGVISATTNSQIVARTSPRLIDLYAALASGAVGAFAMSRKDIANTLPGVAIAIALVPPLAVVGLMLSQGEWNKAGGAFLLFFTNFLSILLAGGGVFALLGLSKSSTANLKSRERRNAFLLIVLGALLVIVPLTTTSINTGKAGFAQFYTTQAVKQWLHDTDDYELVNVVADDSGSVKVRISGAGELPPTEDLVADLSKRLDEDTTVRLVIIPSKRQKLVVTH
jgi:uncharacterized hydrophobic protein (TIGR00271 family)